MGMKGEGNTDHPDDAGIERLLREVGARNEPTPEMTAEVFDAVKAEWQSVVSERRRRKRVVGWGIAAGVGSLAVALGIGWRALQVEQATIASVAHIEGHLLGSTAGDRWRPRSVGEPVAVGEVVQTDDRSRASLLMEDGTSLRLDQNTRLRVAALDQIVLDAGAVYVDAQTDAAPQREQVPALLVEAQAGSVRHVGTQYQVRTHANDMEVSVREGRVEITGARGTSMGEAGERVLLTTDGALSRTPVSPQDAQWDWVVRAGPVFEINDRSLADFLRWVARETGRTIVYRSAAAESAAQDVRLHGSIAGLDPDTALATVLSTTQLRRHETRSQLIGIDLASSEGSR